MPKNLRSIALLCFLACIALFLIGFRLGKHISSLDKNYQPPTPTTLPSITPTPTTSLGIPKAVLEDFTNKNCKITYKLSSAIATLKPRTSTIYINCSVPTSTLIPSLHPTKNLQGS